MTARVILHLPAKVHADFRQMKIYGIHAAIERLVTARGGRVDLAQRNDALFGPEPLRGDGDLHVVENGQARGPGYLNAALAYLDGFFHLDPEGVLADSSLRHLHYDLACIDAAMAQAYFAALQARFVARRRSRYGQRKTLVPVPAGAIAVFLQGPKPERHGQAHMSTAAMLRTVCQGAGGRPVLVKVHPLKPELGREQIARARDDGAVMIETDANVHDILDVSAVSVSINSATGFEGFLHGTPAIFFGRSDFHQCVETVRTPQDFPGAMHRALTTSRDYARAMSWYFGQHCLDLKDPGLDERLIAAFIRAGFPPERLGLSG